MRIHQVEMTGFESFRGTETVNFDDFADSGIFLITGRTGAGKTSILDAITFALFGMIPRYDGQAGSKVRSDYLEAGELCQVRLEFSIDQTRYRVTRSPEYQRPKQRGSGFAKQDPKAELACWNGVEWELIEAQLGKVNQRVREVVRLDATQFQQVILLAQGRFEEFLVANSKDRSELLRTLFGTHRLSDYGQELDRRARELHEGLADAASQTKADVASLARESGQIAPDTLDLDSGAGVQEWAEALVTEQQAVLAAATGQELQFGQQRQLAGDALQSGEVLAERQLRWSRASSRRQELAGQTDSIAADAKRLDDAQRATLVWPLIKRLVEADASELRGREAHRLAKAELHTVWAQADSDLACLEQAIEGLTRESGVLAEQVELEAALPRLTTDAQTAQLALTAFDQQSQSWVTRQTQLGEQMAELAGSLPALAAASTRYPEVKAAFDQLSAKQAMAVKAARTADELELAKAAAYQAGVAVTAASAALDGLRLRQLDGYAAVLAQGLVTEQPCLVCGSLDHPRPAAVAPDAVTDEQLGIAEESLKAAIAQSELAARKASLLGERARQEQDQADHQDAETLAAMAAQAGAEMERLAQDRARYQQAIAARESAAEELKQCAKQIEQRSQQRSLLVESQARASQKAEVVAATVEQSRQGFVTVAARLGELNAQLAAAKTLVVASRALAAAETESAVAQSELKPALAEHGFTDREQANALRLPESEQAVLHQRVTTHQAQTKAVAIELEAPELQDLATTPVDVVALRETLGRASDAHEGAVAARSRAEQSLGSLTGLSTGIASRLAGIGKVRERYQVVARLAATTRGQSPNLMKMSLESFVLAAELEEIVRAANGRLPVMTSGRYEFQHSDALAGRGAQSGLDLKVMDTYTGEARSPQSLSGGEKFQASLALALGLAEVVSNRAGGMRLETLFIDEGFGSLSEDTLETTMATLDGLREGGRVIGLISHVQSMKETIPTQIQVNVTDGGWSTISGV
jgi:DNA repair protein SbcC/Rad50